MSHLLRFDYDFTVSFSNNSKEYIQTFSFLDLFRKSVLYKAISCLYKNIRIEKICFQSSFTSPYCKGEFKVYRGFDGYPDYVTNNFSSYKGVSKFSYEYKVKDLYRDKFINREDDSDTQDVDHVYQFRYFMDEYKNYSFDVYCFFEVKLYFGTILPNLEFGFNRYDGSATPENVMQGYTFFSNDIVQKQVGTLVSDVLVYDLKSFPTDDLVIEAPVGVLWNKVVIHDGRTDVKAVPPIDGTILPKGFQFLTKQQGAIETTKGVGCGRANFLSTRRKILDSLVRMDFRSVLPEIIKNNGAPSSTTEADLTLGSYDVINPDENVGGLLDIKQTFKDLFKNVDIKGFLKTVTTSKKITKNGTYQYRNDLMSLSKTLKITVETQSIPVEFYSMYWMRKYLGRWTKWSDFEYHWNDASMILFWPFSPPTLVPAQVCVVMINDTLSSSYYIWVIRGVGVLSKVYPPGESTDAIRYQGRYWIGLLPDTDGELNPYDFCFVIQPKWYDGKITPDEASAKRRLLAIAHPTTFGRTMTWINNVYFKMVKNLPTPDDPVSVPLDKDYIEEPGDEFWPDNGPWENQLDLN